MVEVFFFLSSFLFVLFSGLLNGALSFILHPLPRLPLGLFVLCPCPIFSISIWLCHMKLWGGVGI